MAYLMLESSIRTHPKFLAAGPEAAWLWLCGYGYCQDGLTNGRIPASAIEYLGVKGARRLARVLVTVRLWDAVEDGWQMHDYLDHNKSAEEVREIMRRRAAGGKLGGRPRKNLEGSESLGPQENLQGFDGSTETGNLSENPFLPVLPVLPIRPITTSESSAPMTAREPSILVFPTVGPKGPEWGLGESQLTEWRRLFPGLDVLAEARKALAWITANPGRRKTVSGMPRFLVSWLTRATDRGGGSAGAGERQFTATELQQYREWKRAVGRRCHQPSCEDNQTCMARYIRETLRGEKAVAS